MFLQRNGEEMNTDESEQLSYNDIVVAAADDNVAFFDVRTPEEYYHSHFPEAELFPLQLLQRGELPSYNSENTTLYVYCRTGNRTVEAVRILREAGYEAINLGGLNDVENIGGTLTEDTCPLGDRQLCLEKFSEEHGEI